MQGRWSENVAHKLLENGINENVLLVSNEINADLLSWESANFCKTKDLTKNLKWLGGGVFVLSFAPPGNFNELMLNSRSDVVHDSFYSLVI